MVILPSILRDTSHLIALTTFGRLSPVKTTNCERLISSSSFFQPYVLRRTTHRQRIGSVGIGYFARASTISWARST